MTDEALLKVYDAEFEGAVVAQESQAEAHAAALRAVFLAGTRAQREMEPTPEMIQAFHDRFIEGADYIAEGSVEYALYMAAIRAMQRAAPLADPTVREEG